VENESSSFKFGAKQTETGAVEKTSINSRQFPQFHPSTELSYRMKLSLTLFLCIISCAFPDFSKTQTELDEESISSILKQVEKDVASFKSYPSRGEKRLDSMLDNISSPGILKKISTPGLVEAAHRRQNTLHVSALIRRIMESARVKATARKGKQKQLKFSVTFQKKVESTAAKVRCYSS
jgi:hypothetical protein